MTVFLVYTFKDPSLLARVCHAVAPSQVVVHVDQKVDERPFRDAVAARCEQVTFVQDRALVNWGGYSQVAAIRKMVRAALPLVRADDEYIVMLSGQCYPLKPLSDLERFLAEHAGRQFLRAFLVADSDEHYRRQATCRHYRDLPILERAVGHPELRRFRNALVRGLEVVARAAPMRPPAGVTLAHGGTHFVLTAACLRVLESWITPDVEDYFRKTFCPEEMFYQSALASSLGQLPPGSAWEPDSYVGRGQYRYANLHHIDPSLTRVYTDADWAEVRRLEEFFIRKVESATSGALLDRIDAELLELDEPRSATVGSHTAQPRSPV